MSLNVSYFGDNFDFNSASPYNFWGVSGFWTLPTSYYVMVDKDGQVWGSPNALTKNDDGTVSGSPKYAVDRNIDGTFVFIDALANREAGYDSPPASRLSGV